MARRRRRFNKKRRKRVMKAKKNQIINISTPQQVLPDKLRLTMSYRDGAVFNQASLSANNFINVRLNGSYDPEEAVGGAQATMFDNWGAIYKKYRVYAVELTSQWGSSGAGAGPLYIGQSYDGGTASTVNQTHALSSLYAPLDTRASQNFKFKLINGGAGSTSTPKLRFYIDFRKEIPGYMQNPETAAEFSALPVQQYFANVGASHVDGISAVTMYCQWNVKYYVELSEPIQSEIETED